MNYDLSTDDLRDMFEELLARTENDQDRFNRVARAVLLLCGEDILTGGAF